SGSCSYNTITLSIATTFSTVCETRAYGRRDGSSGAAGGGRRPRAAVLERPLRLAVPGQRHAGDGLPDGADRRGVGGSDLPVRGAPGVPQRLSGDRRHRRVDREGEGAR